MNLILCINWNFEYINISVTFNIRYKVTSQNGTKNYGWLSFDHKILYASQLHIFTKVYIFRRFTTSHFHKGLHFPQVHNFTFSQRFTFSTGSQLHIFAKVYIFHSFTTSHFRKGLHFPQVHNFTFSQRLTFSTGS